MIEKNMLPDIDHSWTPCSLYCISEQFMFSYFYENFIEKTLWSRNWIILALDLYRCGESFVRKFQREENFLPESK